MDMVIWGIDKGDIEPPENESEGVEVVDKLTGSENTIEPVITASEEVVELTKVGG